MLRTSLRSEFRGLRGSLPFKWDLERLLDDFVFISFLVGNDFLPHLPHLDINTGGLQAMMAAYIEILPSLGGYITRKDQIHLSRFELFIQKCADREPLYFQYKADIEEEELYRSADYKSHYYQLKLKIDPNDVAAKREVVKAYVIGLFWVLRYYHSSEATWKWYYPYLYAPPASDFIDLACINATFEQSRPFAPLVQLLSVLPSQSFDLLPASYRKLISNGSALAQYYPKDFAVDMLGKMADWEGVTQIPFIEEQALVKVNVVDLARCRLVWFRSVTFGVGGERRRSRQLTIGPLRRWKRHGTAWARMLSSLQLTTLALDLVMNSYHSRHEVGRAARAIPL